LDRNADSKQIRDAYRKMAFQYHPDRHKDSPEVADRMKEINEAYAVLSDPAKRQKYDTFVNAYGSSAYGRFRQTYNQEDIFRGSDIHQILEEMARVFGFRGSDDLFRQFYGDGHKIFGFQRPGFSGSAFVFSRFPGGRTWKATEGARGRALKWALRRAWGIEWPETGADQHDIIFLSPERARTGGKALYFHRKRSRELIVHIPKGIQEGQSIRLKGMGDKGKGGAAAGDLYLKVKIRRNLVHWLRDCIHALIEKIKPPA
jgi:DnaJ-class molecular chaperone